LFNCFVLFFFTAGRAFRTAGILTATSQQFVKKGVFHRFRTRDTFGGIITALKNK
jgi:hypothetical protein